MKWYQKTKRAYLLDFQMPDDLDQMPIGQPRNLRNIDIPRIVRELKEARVQAIYMHAKDNQGNCYYDTEYGVKHSGIGERDLLKEISSECRKHGMNILFYVQLSRERRGARYWPAMRYDGSPLVFRTEGPLDPDDDAHPVMCHNGGGREYLKNILRELSENYDFDGFWLDNPMAWMTRAVPCYCPTCKAKYREESGRDLPGPEDKKKETPAWKAYLDYRWRLNTLIMQEYYKTIRLANPELTIVHNGANFSYSMGDDFCDGADYVMHEFHYSQGFGHLSFMMRKLDALKPDHNYEVETWRFFNRGHAATPEARMVRAYQIRPVDHLSTEMAMIIANNALIQYYDQIRPEGLLDDLSLEHMGKAFEHVEQCEPYIPAGQKRIDYASILWSKRTESFANHSHKGTHGNGIKGIHFALTERQILNRLITEPELMRGNLGNPKVIVLDNAECISERACEQIRRYVKRGGGLVATYRTSLADRMGNARSNFLLADVFGCDYREPVSFTYSFYKFTEENALSKGIPLNWDMTLWSKLQLKVDPTTGESVGNIVNPMRGMKMGHPPQETTWYPAAVTNRFGKGRVVYLPQEVGHGYWDYGHQHQQKLIENAVRWAAGCAQPVEVSAPETVESVLYEHEGNFYLHLINKTACGSVRAVENVFNYAIPVYNLSVDLNIDVKSAMEQPSGRKLGIVRENGSARLDIPELRIHTIICLETF